MANSILKLNVESSEYDAKLKKAAEGIRHLADVAHKSGGELTGLEQAELDYIKALGEMETKSRSAAGKTRELESAFKELTVVYNELSDVEKADEGGKALAASLAQIKQRAIDAKAQLDAASKSLQDNGNSAASDSSMLDQLASKFTINIDAIKLFNIGVQAAGVALDVARDAFMSSETNVDDWGRTIRSAESIYQSFLQSLNTGDFSGFLTNIGQVTQAAREAYNALDELGTRMTIINPERARLQARQQELRADIRRNGADSEVGKAALAELKKIEPLLAKSFKTESQMNYNAFENLVKERLSEGGINLNQKSFNEFMKTFSSDAAFQQLRKNARGSITSEVTGNAYNPNAVVTRRTVDTRNTEQKLLDLFTDEWRNANSGYLTAAFNAQGAAASNALGNARYMKAGISGGGGRGAGNVTTLTFADDSIMAQEKLVQELTQKWKTAGEGVRDGYLKQLNDAQATLDKMLGKTKPVDLNKLFPDYSKQNYNTGYAGSSQAKIDSARADMAQSSANFDSINSYISGIKSALQDADLGSELYNSLTENLNDASTMSAVLQAAIAGGVEGADLSSVAEELKQKLLEGDISDDAWQELLDRLNEKITDSDLKLVFNVDTKSVETASNKMRKSAEQSQKAWSLAAQSVTSLGSALNAIEDPGIKAAGTVIKAIADVALGFAQASVQAGSLGPYAWLAWLAAGTAAMATTISTVHSLTGFSNGGIVGGNSYSGDNIYAGSGAMVNSGELILNRSQQNSIAGQLTSADRGGGTDKQPYIDGEYIYLGLQAYLRRSGMGEIVTANG